MQKKGAIKMKVKLMILSLMIIFFLPAGAFSVQICGVEEYASTANGEYMAQNNIWGASTPQCISVNGTSFSVVSSSHNLTTSGSPASYPSLFKGCHWTTCTTANSPFPIQVSAVQSAPISWSNTLISSGAYNVTTEAWFKKNSTPGAPDGAELMIWINSNGGPQPGGSQIGSANINGQSWQVWYASIGWNFITYRLNGSATSINLDYRPFIDDAISRGYVQASWYMMDIEAGFEIWQGGAGLACTNFTASVNSGTNTPAPTAVQTSAPTVVPTAAPGNIGDVNNSGAIDIVDALLVAQYYVGLNPSNFDISKADTNCNGSVDIVDALLIAQYYVGLISRFC
jgi:hypothetical protein